MLECPFTKSSCYNRFHEKIDSYINIILPALPVPFSIWSVYRILTEFLNVLGKIMTLKIILLK